MRIENDRYIIRKFTNEDSLDLYAYLSLKEIYTYEPGEPITMEEAIKIVRERSENNNFFAVVDKQANRLIGHFSFFQTEPYYVNTYELGFIFNPEYQGKGHATESGKMFIKYCFTDMKIHKIVSNCNPENTQSWKLLERLGFEREGLLRKNIYFKQNNGDPVWLDTYVYGFLNSDFM